MSAAPVSPDTLPEMLRDALYRNGVTQTDAAREIGVPKQAFHDWLYGKRTPSTVQAPHVASWLGISTRELRAVIGEHFTPASLNAELRATRAELDQVKSALASLMKEVAALQRDVDKRARRRASVE